MAHICDDRHPMKPLSRRTFLVGMPTATVALAVLPGCDKREKVVCDAPEKLSGLSAAERATRTSSQYIDSSKIAAKTCDNCSLFETPSSAFKFGGCKVVKGPIYTGGCWSGDCVICDPPCAAASTCLSDGTCSP